MLVSEEHEHGRAAPDDTETTMTRDTHTPRALLLRTRAADPGSVVGSMQDGAVDAGGTSSADHGGPSL